ncbi:MAG: hypothetical protein JWR16_2796, partial [Nevskia sp.]|nr:hypothetical protein [Nevskia sp.]
MRLRRTTFRICITALLACACISTAAAAGVERLTRISLTVADLQRTEKFYHDGLGFTRVAEQTLSDAAY